MSSRSASPGRLATSACALILTLVACGSIPAPEVESRPRGRTFIPTIPDSADDVGLGSSITVDDEGRPYVSYFGFVAQLAEGEIPVARPIGSPYLQTEEGQDSGAVLLASLSAEQIWTRGAVAQARDTPSGVTVPFGPATEPSLRSLTPGNAQGTDVAVAGPDVHATWTANTGVWYGAGPSFEIEPVEATPEAGTPSVVVDDGGSPLVAYALAGTQPEIRVAERDGEGWQTTSVTTLSECGRGCPPPVEIGIVGGEPIVVVADPASGELIAAGRQGATWSTEVVAGAVSEGASLATSDGGAAIAYYTDGGVSVATGASGRWSTQEVASTGPAGGDDDDAGRPPPSTGIAIDGEGTTWVAWEDADGIHLASAAEGDAFEEVDLAHVEGGMAPSVAAAEDGAVYLSWYDPEDADLLVGIYAEAEELLIAAPSPTPEADAAPAPTEGCEPSGTTLEVVAQGVAFDTDCLAAPAQQAFEIVFDNQDLGIQHNVAIYTDSSAAETLFQGETFPGVAEQTYDVEPLQAGDFFFRCDVHPDTMTGAFIVAEDGGGGGAGGDGGEEGGGGGDTGNGGGGGNGGNGGGDEG